MHPFSEESYLAYAIKAVVCEQHAKYTEASHLWYQAALVAKNSNNRRWAEAREDYCYVQNMKPFSSVAKVIDES